jgi:hypothetical protein
MRRRAWLAGTVAVMLIGACGLSQHAAKKDEPPELSAERLGDLSEQDSILDLLDPEEREAMQRTGMSGARPVHEGDPVPAKGESALDKAGRATFSILTVASPRRRWRRPSSCSSESYTATTATPYRSYTPLARRSSVATAAPRARAVSATRASYAAPPTIPRSGSVAMNRRCSVAESVSNGRGKRAASQSRTTSAGALCGGGRRVSTE